MSEIGFYLSTLPLLTVCAYAALYSAHSWYQEGLLIQLLASIGFVASFIFFLKWFQALREIFN